MVANEVDKFMLNTKFKSEVALLEKWNSANAIKEMIMF